MGETMSSSTAVHLPWPNGSFFFFFSLKINMEIFHCVDCSGVRTYASIRQSWFVFRLPKFRLCRCSVYHFSSVKTFGVHNDFRLHYYLIWHKVHVT